MTFTRRPSVPVSKRCITPDCGIVFLGIGQQKFCTACQEQRKKASDKAHQQRVRDFERRDHLSPAQVERVFQEALAEIRRERRHTADVGSSEAWKYEGI